MSETTDRFADLVRDLLHLEITLVRRPFVDRVKAPDPKGQMVELAESYRAEIQAHRELTRQVSTQMSGLESLAAAAPEEVTPVQHDDLRSSFAGLMDNCQKDISNLQDMKKTPAGSAAMEAATSGLESVGATPAGPAPAVLAKQEQKLQRIHKNSRQLRDIMDQINGAPAGATGMESAPAGGTQPAGQMTPAHVMQIRKLWELRPGDEILMRTVISMDGDVIAQVDPDFAGAEFAYLHKLHDDSVQVSVAFWKELIGILSDFLNNLVNRFFPARGT